MTDFMNRYFRYLKAGKKEYTEAEVRSIIDGAIQEKREWVGLTKTEFNEATNNLEDLEDCWIAIEAKLKEKNNG